MEAQLSIGEIQWIVKDRSSRDSLGVSSGSTSGSYCMPSQVTLLLCTSVLSRKKQLTFLKVVLKGSNDVNLSKS